MSRLTTPFEFCDITAQPLDCYLSSVSTGVTSDILLQLVHALMHCYQRHHVVRVVWESDYFAPVALELQRALEDCEYRVSTHRFDFNDGGNLKHIFLAANPSVYQVFDPLHAVTFLETDHFTPEGILLRRTPSIEIPLQSLWPK